MCGIFAVFGKGKGSDPAFRERAIELSKKIRHRGPDWSGVKSIGENDVILCHERLAIVGVDSGAQPLTNSDDSVLLSVNGEIYNHNELRKQLKQHHTWKTNSDCEVILHLYEELGREDPAMFLNLIDGMFSFVLYDRERDLHLVARDHIGITTMYMGWRSEDGSVWYASEMKSLNEDCDRIISFPPGHFYSSATKEFTQYYRPAWFDHPVKGLPTDEEMARKNTPDEDEAMYTAVRESLEAAVQKRLMSEVPYGVLLSGGLDSSLIASIAVRLRKKEQQAEDGDDVGSSISNRSPMEQLHSFSIGLPNSPDLVAAARAARHLGTRHHAFTFTTTEGLDAIPDVIHHLETYDVTTVRASTPMWLLSRKVKAAGVKMVLSGEGSDEALAGYLYFHDAPDARALHAECVSRLRALHTADTLRANKSTMAWGLEARVPFLDRDFLDVVMQQVPASHKLTGKAPYYHRMEKHVLRKAFDDKEEPYLPDEILWRQKEQFSDGVGYGWIDALRDHAEAVVSDEEFETRRDRFPDDTPSTKEAFWYRRVFEKHFPQRACLESVVRWVPRADWGCPEDPSGRAQRAHAQAYKKSLDANGNVDADKVDAKVDAKAAGVLANGDVVNALSIHDPIADGH